MEVGRSVGRGVGEDDGVLDGDWVVGEIVGGLVLEEGTNRCKTKGSRTRHTVSIKGANSRCNW